MYDLLIVGARVAGSPTAMLAARAGLKVLVVDRATFPSDQLSTNYIHQPGVARLARWGILDRLIATGCPPIPTTRFQLDDVVIEGGVSSEYGQLEAYAPRRYVLDELLVEAAREAGAEVREGCRTLELVREGNRIVGAKVQGRDRKISVERARLVVGADGMHSFVAREVGAGFTHQDPKVTCAYYTFWEGLDARYELYEGAGGWVGAVPTHNHILVATYHPQGDFPRIRTDAARHHLEMAERVAPNLAARMRKAKQVDKLWGTGDQQNYFRRVSGPGWALVGDASHHKDSITARGITDGFVQSELLVTRIAKHFDSPETLDRALSRYAEDHERLMMPGYRATLALAHLEGRDERRALLSKIAARPDATNLYFDVVAGIRPPTDLQAALGTTEEVT